MRFNDYIRATPKDGKVRLTIRISDNSLDAWIISPKAFKQISEGWDDTEGKTIKDSGLEIFVQHKHIGMPTEYVRISICPDSGPIREYRLLPGDMRALSSDA